MFLRPLVLFVASKIPTCRASSKVNYKKALMHDYQTFVLPVHLPASRIAYLPLLTLPPEKHGRKFTIKREENNMSFVKSHTKY
jgi:hypothetical protein